MVFFSCGECGESLKKNAVEKHYMTKCRSCNVLSCIDCQKDFWGDDYKQHVKCISEDEKYSGKNYKPKPGANKGEAKQDAWIHQVQQAIQKAPNNPKLRDVLQRMEEYSNIPRKKAKFENFVTNSMRVRDKYLVSQVWDLISAEMNKAPENTNNKSAEDAKATLSEKQTSDKHPDTKTILKENDKSAKDTEEESEKKLSKREKKELRRQKQDKQEKKDKKSEQEIENGEEEVSKKKKKSKNKENETDIKDDNKKQKKKRKRDDDETEEKEEVEETIETPKKKMKKDKKEETEDQNEEQEEETEVVKGKFKWEAAIIGALLGADDNTLTIKKLRKKVMAEYASRESGEGQTEEKLLAKFNKKISKNPRLKVHKERVKLLR